MIKVADTDVYRPSPRMTSMELYDENDSDDKRNNNHNNETTTLFVACLLL